jgi:hypothetical protein
MSMFEKLAHRTNNVLIKPRRVPLPWDRSDIPDTVSMGVES